MGKLPIKGGTPVGSVSLCKNPRRAEQRRGDSDVNWGDSDSDDGVEQLSTGVGDMEIDEGIDLAAMKKFVHSMSAEGSRHVTMDDVADMERMRQEDEEEPVRGAESAEAEEAIASKTREGPTGSAATCRRRRGQRCWLRPGRRLLRRLVQRAAGG